MADANETTYPSYISMGDSEHPRCHQAHWERVSDTTGWEPSLQLTVHLKGNLAAEARDRVLTLCAVYTGEELLRILPTAAEARLKLAPNAELAMDEAIGGLRHWLGKVQGQLDNAKEDGYKQMADMQNKVEVLERQGATAWQRVEGAWAQLRDLAGSIRALSKATEQHLRDIEIAQTAMQREIERLRK